MDAEGALAWRFSLERARIHLLLLDDADKGLADAEADRVKDAKSARQELKEHRTAPA